MAELQADAATLARERGLPVNKLTARLLIRDLWDRWRLWQLAEAVGVTEETLCSWFNWCRKRGVTTQICTWFRARASAGDLPPTRRLRLRYRSTTYSVEVDNDLRCTAFDVVEQFREDRGPDFRSGGQLELFFRGQALGSSRTMRRWALRYDFDLERDRLVVRVASGSDSDS